MKLLLRSTLAYLGAAAGLAGLIALAGRAFRPDVSAPPPPPPPELLAQVEASRHVTLDRDHPPVVIQDVDYAAADPAWRPREEAPALRELADAGRLPPVAARVGPEPVVMAGVDGAGRYGGTWYRLCNSERDVLTTESLLESPTLVRWSPQGYPLRPFVAKSMAVSPDHRVYTFALRRGMKWSDGEPFTADDILFWWRWEVQYFHESPRFMRIAGRVGTLEKIDDEHVRFTFPVSNPLFPERLAFEVEYACPAHYLRRFHPALGDPAEIRALMAAQRLSSPAALYRRMKEWRNPELPRLSAWIYRRYRPSAPYTFVRNPYFCAVDPQGRQLPYLDRVVITVKAQSLVPISAAAGELTMQARHIFSDDHTLLLGSMQRGGYRVLHWLPSWRSVFTIYPVLNRRVEPGRPETAFKARLLNDARFRQALSLAIDRQEIIDAVFDGQGEPAQLDPGPQSEFHDPGLFHSFTAHDPARAGRLLDAIGLTRRDDEGYRTFPDGSRMTFFLHLTNFTPLEPAQFVIDDWAKVGVRAVLRLEGRPLFYAEKAAYRHDFDVWTGDSEFQPLVEPRNFVPTYGESFYAPAYGRWYQNGGLYGDPAARALKGAIAPPPGHPLRRAMELLDQADTANDPAERRRLFHAIQQIAARNVWTISIATPPPQLVIVKDGLRNVPDHALFGAPYRSPANTGPETFCWVRTDEDLAAVAEAVQRELTHPTAMPATAPAGAGGRSRGWLGFALVAAAAGLVALGRRHRFIGRRLLLMIPTLGVASILIFTIIQAPPSDFITARIQELEMTGDASAAQQIADLKAGFHPDEPQVTRYLRWVGLRWFATFRPEDEGLLQGNLGRSMEVNRPVNDIVGDRILLTIVVAGLTLVFTWIVALPAGIVAAVRQYSVYDYVLTFIGFVGMSVPSFLFALILIYVSGRWFDIEVTGLFSPHYATQAAWTWGKFVDLLHHLWIPVLVLGLSGTAAMIRVMRANLLDELRKPYVTTARAKGVRPLRLLLKYPVRIALNPFISGLGTLIPHLISGGTIIALVLSLPIIGPEMLAALMNQDTYFAGSMLMVLSLLGIAGTLVSDLLLLWLDPRIRLGGGRR